MACCGAVGPMEGVTYEPERTVPEPRYDIGVKGAVPNLRSIRRMHRRLDLLEEDTLEACSRLTEPGSHSQERRS